MKSGDIEKRINVRFRDMGPYVPIEPTDVISQNIGIPEDDIIKLDGNENPYGSAPQIRNALSNFRNYHHYPDPEQRHLRKALEKHTGISADTIIAGAGSDELIEVILKLFLEPGDKVINCTPTFGMYQFCTDVCGGKVVNIPRRDDFSLDIPAIKKAMDVKSKVMFIASPNNPSGNLVSEEEIKQLLDEQMIIVVDEAYHEFSKVTCLSLITRYPNLIVLRTFSKWAGLAGLRVGYGFFPKNIVPYVMKIKQPYNINSAAQVAALESLKNIGYLQKTIDLIIAERQHLFDELSKFEWMRVYPSRANFILCRLLKGNAKEIHEYLQHKGIFIRYFDNPVLKDYLRFSVGKPEHTEKLVSALHDVVQS